MLTWSDALPYIGDPDAPDSSLHLSDRDIAAALVEEFIALSAARLLSERHGRIVSAHDVRRRIAASPILQRVQHLAEQRRMQGAVANCRQAVAKQRIDRQRKLADWHRLHQERMQGAVLRYVRNHSLCGAKTRTGAPCKRRPELGKARCRNHGGCSTGPRTPEGRARALDALARGRQQRRRNLPPA